MIEIDIKPKKDINVEFNIPVQTISGETVSDYNQLNNKPKINNIELVGDKTLDELGIQSKGDYLTKNTADKTYQEKGNYALKSEIPTKTSQLNNDSNLVEDSNYVHTDNNYTDEDKDKLASLENYDDTEVKSDIANLQTNKADKSEIPDVSNFVTRSVDNLLNYYLKSETYTKEQVNQLISTITSVRFELVNELPSTGENNIIYLVPSSNPKTRNVKDEFIWINNAWEQIGSTSIDLSDYVTTTQLNIALSNYTTTNQLNTLLNGYVQKEQGKGLSSNDYTTAEKDKLDGLSNYDDTSIKEEISNIEKNKADKTEIPDISNLVDEQSLTEALKTKQDKLILGNNIVIKDGIISAKERTWKKVRTITIPSDDYKGQEIDGVRYGYHVSSDGGIKSITFSTDENGELLSEHSITGAMIKLTSTDNININQGFASINSNGLNSNPGYSLDYITNIKVKTSRWFEYSLQPFYASLVTDNPGRYKYPAQYTQKQINNFSFGGFEAASVLGEGTKLEIWMYGYWD